MSESAFPNLPNSTMEQLKDRNRARVKPEYEKNPRIFFHQRTRIFSVSSRNFVPILFILIKLDKS